jgi:hypothetical protein
VTRETDAQVEEAERDIDAFFDAQLRVKGVRRSALVGALLERAELIVTGHRVSEEKYDAAIRSLYLNTAGGLNWAVPRQNLIRVAQEHRAPRSVNPSTGPRPRAWLEVRRPASLDRRPCTVTRESR